MTQPGQVVIGERTNNNLISGHSIGRRSPNVGAGRETIQKSSRGAHEKFRDGDAQTSAHGIVFLHLVFRKAFKIVFSLCKRTIVESFESRVVR